jgi:hypothetical protein
LNHSFNFAVSALPVWNPAYATASGVSPQTARKFTFKVVLPDILSTARKGTHRKTTLSTGTAMSEYLQALEKYLEVNPSMGKEALVELLTKRFPKLSREEAWILVSRYFNKKT